MLTHIVRKDAGYRTAKIRIGGWSYDGTCGCKDGTLRYPKEIAN
jgi:hypothetical protein